MSSIARKSAAAGQALGLRRRGRYRRGRRRRRRPGHGAVQPLAGQRGRAAGEGRRARRHHQEGGLLVLGAEQQAHAGDRHRGHEGRLHPLHGAAVAPRSLRSRATRRFGMSQWEYDSYAAIYDNASPATELLAEKGALEYRHCDFVPDYWAEIPEDKAPKGRVLLPKDALPTMSDGGEVAIRTMGGKARADGIDIRTGHRVAAHHRRRQWRGDRRRGRHRQGQDRRHQGAQGAVIFATGGFTHDVTMRKNFLSVPVFGGCAARSNEGDFVNIGTRRRRRTAQHELCLDVPDRAGEGAERRSGADRHLLAVGRLHDLCRQDRPPRHQREARLQ